MALVCCGAALPQAASAADDTSSNASNGGIETVVVTAERRNEDLMKTPISADVLSGADLQAKGVLSLNDLQFVAPALTIDNFGQGVDFNIRGIGKGEHNSQTMTGVITYRDGTPTFPGYILEEPYYDIASIEVLRGPQGTFVGQNATGGAVFVTTNNPDPSGGYDGYGMAQVGNYGDTAVQGAVNIPVSDTFAIRVALDGENRGSFYSITDSDPTDACPGNRYAGCKPRYNPGDLQYAAGRIGLLWKPTDALTISLKTDVDYLDNGGYPASPYTDLFAHKDLFHVSANAPQSGLDQFIRSTLRADYVFPDGITLRSVSSYQHGITTYSSDLDGTDSSALGIFSKYTFFDHVNETIYTQEFNLISPDDQRLTWIFGGFAQADRYGWTKPYQFIIGTPFFPGFPPASQTGSYQLQGSTPNAAWAVFGQAGYKITPKLQVQLGGRWSANSAHNDVDILQYGAYFLANQKTSSYSVDYKASLNYSVDDDNFLYAFVATGYKPGGLNVPVFVGDPTLPFGPERVTEYEGGWKGTLLDGHLRTTLDGYYNDYKGFQVTIGYPLFPTFGREINIPNTTTIYGMEAEIEAAFGQFSLSAGLGLNHSELGAFYAVDPRTSSIMTVCDPAAGSATHDPHCEFLGGNPQTYAPSVTGDIGAQYAFDIGGGDTVTPRVSYAYQSGQWATLFDKPATGDRLGTRNIFGAQLEWKHDTWVATLYGSNLGDQHYVAALNSGFDYAGPPRQFGVRLLKLF
ncbi:MAG TPA: TonB-dependent receptor [Rhizomicrobium sp.]